MVSKRVFLGSNFFHKHDVFFTQIWVQKTRSQVYTPFGVHDGNVDLCTLRGILFDSSQFLLRFVVKHGLPSQTGSMLRYITNKIYSRPSKWIILYVHHFWTSPIHPVLHSTKAPWLLCLSRQRSWPTFLNVLAYQAWNIDQGGSNEVWVRRFWYDWKTCTTVQLSRFRYGFRPIKLP